ncbi:MAG: tetratricopeptide repeat protein [Spirochaetes bacterium]|nr:tetratricopeptide repeat protein [Spirochaetota bacterium]
MTIAIIIASIIFGIGLIVIAIVLTGSGSGTQKAIRYFEQGNFDAALAIFDKLSKSRPADVDYKWYLARCYEAKKSFDKALRLYSDLARRKGSSELFREFDLRARLADIYLKREDIASAEQEIELMAKLKPDSAAVQIRLAELALSKGDSTKAVAALRKALVLEPQNGSVSRALGMTYYRSGNFDDAFAAFVRALEMGTADAEMYFHMGMAAQETKKLSVATRYFEQAAKSPLWASRSRVKIGICYFETGNFAAASGILEEAVKGGGTDEDSLSALYYLAQIRATEGKISNALQYWERIYAIQPAYRDVQDKINTFGRLKSGKGTELDRLLGMSANEFLASIKKIMVKMGHTINKEEVTPEKIRLYTAYKQGASIFETIVEAGKWINPIGELHIRELLSKVQEHRADRGIIITPSFFTDAAIKTSERYAVDLIDGEKLQKMLAQLKQT